MTAQADALEDYRSWLRLTLTPGIGAVSARRLLSAFGDPTQIFEAKLSALGQVVAEPLARQLRETPNSELSTAIEKTIDWLQQGPDHYLLTFADPHYPAPLLNTTDPPPLLYAKGRLELLSTPTLLAIVGSRSATAQGIRIAEDFARVLSQAGITIVSGMALGIDGAAHQGALSGRGSTVAVVGTGIDVVYPARHRALAHRIAADGLILSEFPLGTGSVAHNFPRRNRLISGLSKGVLVVEAAIQSGSLITARLAGEQGRDVFAIPGSIHSPHSKGCHALIKQGAKLVESAQDILEEWGTALVSARTATATAAVPTGENVTQDPVLSALSYGPSDMDQLASLTGWPVGPLAARLLELELEGKVATLPGGQFQALH